MQDEVDAVTAKMAAEEAAEAAAEAEAKEKREGPMRKLMQAFDQFDKDASGTITKAELTFVFRKLDAEKFTDEVCEEMFNMADANDDGLVDYEEFCEWIFDETPAPVKQLIEVSGADKHIS